MTVRNPFGPPVRAFGAFLALLAGFLAPGCGGSDPPGTKVLVIGLDGADFTLIGPWMDAGRLPRLRAIRDEGISGPLLSVIPPLSPPAWTTAATGVNPGRHGIFDFFRMDPDSLVAYTETAASRRVPGVWTLLSEAGRRVGILNMPMTDPPDPVDGFQIGGLPHPDSTGFAYPAPLEARLHAEGYRLDRMGEALIPGEEAALEAEILDTFRRRSRLALALGEENPDLDLYWVVFTGTDRMQHFFWKFMEPEHPFHDPGLAPRFGDSILRLYEEVDRVVGELVDQARSQAQGQGRELAVLVISDHGFYGVHRAFRPQSFLRNPPSGEEPITQAYSLETNASMLFVPERGRERNAVLSPEEHDALADTILRRMLEARDPESGASPIAFGARREDVYRGLYVDKAPDLVFLARPPYYLIHEEGDKEPFGTPEFSFSAHHGFRGILMAQGPMFRKGVLEGRQGLIDLAPTLMYLAGEPVPGYMEGEVLTGLIDAGYLDAHPVVRDASESVETGSEDLEPIRAIPYVQ
jgi:predicted AlkP superfamily phosphohydrolase/phosphomutase